MHVYIYMYFEVYLEYMFLVTLSQTASNNWTSFENKTV
jgi:hypothetical protein